MLIIDPASHMTRIYPHGKTILLVGRQGHLRDALMSLLCTLPDLALINTAENSQLAVGVAGSGRPDLLIAGSLPEEETNDLLQQFKENWPETPTLVLTENVRQVKRVELAGATRVLPARTPSRQLLMEIAGLIKQ
jgi:DNA-binding NarL/FixJ family response regulator